MSRSRPWPAELDEISTSIGLNRNLVQGPGGNTSWKSGKSVWVKASGFQLRDALENEIFCEVDIKNPLINLRRDNKSPSIESTLHAAIPAQFVIHIHSVASMALSCIKLLDEEHYDLLESLDLAVVRYARPGLELAVEFESSLNGKNRLTGALLKNHGLVSWGDDIEKVFQRVLTIEKTFEDFLKSKRDSSFLNHFGDTSRATTFGYITPDHAVFGNVMKNVNTGWLKDLDWAIKSAIQKIPKDVEIAYLSDEEVHSLRNWEAEKNRLGMNT